MDNTPNLNLSLLANKQALRSTFHDDALKDLDTLVMLAAIDRDLSSPPASPSDGDRYIVKTPGSGDPAWVDDNVVVYIDGGWTSYAPQVGWTCWVADEQLLLAWSGSAWEPAVDPLGGGSELQNLSLLGVGTAADASNPVSAKLNNALWVAKTVAEGGDGTLRYKLSKENAAATLSFLFQDNFSGRAEIGLTGDDDFHFKTSADGNSWIDALVLDKITGAVRLNSGLFLSGDLAPSQIAADQDDYNPTGLSSASVLRLSTDASRSITGLADGGDGRLMAIVNVGANPIVLKDASAASGAANRFAFGADVTLAAKRSAVLWYDATDNRWKLFAGPQAAGGGGGEVTSTGASTTGNIPKFSDTSADVIEDSGIAAANILVDADIGIAVQAYDAELAALAGLTSAANKLPFFTGTGTATLADLTSYGRSIVAVADEAAFKALVNLEIGTDVQAQDAELSALAGLTSAANKIPYFTGAGTASVADFSSYGRSLVAVADEAAFKALVNLEIGTDVQAPLAKEAIFIIDGGGAAITAGIKGDLVVPFACSIIDATLLADQTGSIVIDIWKDTYANFPPTVADTITASAKPTLSGASKSHDATLTGWTTSISAGDVLRFNVDSASTVTRVTVALKLVPA